MASWPPLPSQSACSAGDSSVVSRQSPSRWRKEADMTKTDGFDPGLFCWAELATTDRAAGKSFYESLFGWDSEDNDIPGGVYTMFTIGGRQVGAAAEQFEEERSKGVPPHWNLYISVDDADSYAKKTEAAGGTVVM